MRPFGAVRWVCALAAVGFAAVPAQAAWDNVFQVCCFGCKHGGRVSSYGAYSAYAPAACCPQPAPCCASPAPCCPQPQCCTTQYVQRSYYQPVTCYQAQTTYEPVTTYKTSYYYEPVTSYRYSCYFDPCTCSYQQVACPQTCYRLRSQTCAVTSYLQRTCQVPVTSYRLSYYYEPVTTCTPACTPCSTPCAPAPCAPAAAAPAVSEQPLTAPPAAPPAGVQERAAPPAPNGNGNGDDRRYYPPPTQPPPMPKTSDTNYRPAPPPVVRLDRIVSVPKNGNQVEGKVVLNNNAPRGNVELLFVSTEKQGPQEKVTADTTGRFNVQLASGNWLVYMAGADGKPVFHSKIDVNSHDVRPVVLVSR